MGLRKLNNSTHFIVKFKCVAICLTSSSAHTRSALSACTAADITLSTLSSNAKRSRKSRPASSRVDKTLPVKTDTYSPARAYGEKDKVQISASAGISDAVGV